MTGRAPPSACHVEDARTRAAHARAYLQVAKLIRGDADKPEELNFNQVAAVTLSWPRSRPVTPSAAACWASGRAAKTRDAVALLEQVRFGTSTDEVRARRARDLARALATALDLKDDSHYGTLMVGATELRWLIRAAEVLALAALEVT